VKGVLNRWNGLKDDAVHDIALNRRGDLLLGLARGYAVVQGLGKASVFDGRNGFEDGPALAVLQSHGAVFAVTPESVGKIEKVLFNPLPPIRTLIRDAAATDRDLFVCGFGGIWRLGDSGDAWETERIVEADVFCMAPADRNRVYFMERNRIDELVRTERGWATHDLGQDVGDTPTGIVLSSGEIWVSTATNGIWRFQTGNNPDRPGLFLRARYREGRGLPPDAGRPVVHAAGNRVFAFTPAGVLGIQDENRGFEPVPRLVGWDAIAATRGGGPVYWAAVRHGIPDAPAAVLRIEVAADGGVELSPVGVSGLDGVGRVTGIEAIGGTLWIGGTRGVLRVEPGGGNAIEAPRVRLTSAFAYPQSNGKEDGSPRRLDLDAARPVALGVEIGKLHFDFAADSDNEEPVFFETALGNEGSTWSGPSREPPRDFSGLAAGEHTFRVRAIDRFGKAGPEAALAFSIAKPFWLTWPAFAGYGAALALAIAGGVRWRLRRLRRQNERLNRLVDERTRELAMSNTAKTEFLASISHEIRNPLNGIVGLVAMLKDFGLGKREKDLAQSISACAKTLARVFDEVLNFSKIEAGQLSVERRPFSLPALLDEVVALHRVTAMQRGCELRISGGATSVSPVPRQASGDTEVAPPGNALVSDSKAFVGDDSKIKTILGNFVSNAIKYAPGAPVEISTSVEAMDDGRSMLQIQVTDHGPGVPLEEQELIFRKFVRGSSAQTEREPGAGLGLATCRALAEIAGGGVGIEGTPGGGSIFYLRVPVTLAEAAEAPAPVEDREQPPSWLGSESGRALIVDDQHYNQIVATRIAERLGFAPVTAGDAGAALARFSEGSYAVVFLDWDLPGMKGTELARQLRERPNGADPIILATTAHDSDKIHRQCIAAGMDGFILKPFDEAAVAANLAEVRARRQGEGSRDELNLGLFRYVGRDDPERSAALLEEFLQTVGSELAALGEAVKGGDREAVARHAHRLRSYAGLIRTRELNDAAKAMEAAAPGAPREALEDHLRVVERCAGGVRERIEAFRATTAAGSA